MVRQKTGLNAAANYQTELYLKRDSVSVNASNRRLTPRIPLRREIVVSSAEQSRMTSLLLDLSLGGAAILRSENALHLDPDADMHIATTLPTPRGSEEFVAQCRIASINRLAGYGGTIVGLEFINVQPQHRRALTQFLRAFY